MKKKFSSILSGVLLLFLLSLLNGNAWSAATLSQLYETPKDQVTTATLPEYNNLQSYVYDGVKGVTAAGGAELILAMGEGGLVTFNYDSTTPTYGIIDRKTSVTMGTEEVPLFVTRVVADDAGASPDIEYDTVFALSGGYLIKYSLSTTGSLSDPKYVRIYDPADNMKQYEPTDLVIVKDSTAGPTKTYLAVSAREQGAVGGAVFLIAFDNSSDAFDTNTGLPAFDILRTSFAPNAITAVNANVTGTAADLLFIVGPDNIVVKAINTANIGGTSPTDSFSDAAQGTFDGTARDVTVYANAAVDTTEANTEVLIFIATNNGIHGFELDNSGTSYSLEDKGNLTQGEVPNLDSYGVAFNDAGTAGGRAGWLAVAGGTGGLYVFKSGGSASASPDTLTLSYVAALDTTGTTEKVFGFAGTVSATTIGNIYVADGGGGFKDIGGTTMNTAPELKLNYQWDESVAAVATRIVNNGTNDYAVVLDQAGGLKLYQVDTSGTPWKLVPQKEADAQGGKYGFDLAWDSIYSAEGTGTNLAGTPYDLYAAADSGTSTTVHVFVASGPAGIKKMQLTAVGGAFLYDETSANIEAYNTPGIARGVDASQTAAGQFKVAVADGDAGVLLMDYGITTANKFTLNRSLAMQGAGVAEGIAIDKRTASSFVHVAYGDQGLLILDTGDASFSNWSNPTTAAQITGATLSGYAKKVVIGQQGSAYYAYVLVQTATSGNKIVIVDVSTPSSAAVVGTYTAETEVNNLAFVGDTANSKYYLVLSSTNDTVLGQTSRVAVVNVSNPATPLAGTTYGVTGQAIGIAAKYGTNSMVVVGEVLQMGTDNGYKGEVGLLKLSFTGAQTVTVTPTASASVVPLGGSITLGASVSGGTAPYLYSWSVVPRSGTDTGTFNPAPPTAQSVGWTAPQVSDLFTFTVQVTDNDGNVGSGSITVRVRPTGVSVVNRIGKAGSTVTVPIEISGVPSVAIDAWGMDVTFDPQILVFTGVSTPSDLSGWTVTGQQVSSGRVRIAGHAEATDKVIEPGATKTLIYLRFSINRNAAPGTIASVTPSNAVDDIAGVPLTAGNFKLVCPGDVDGSGLLTPQDALWTFYYFLNLYSLQDDEAKVADVDNNGVVNLTDAVEIMNRYVAYGGACVVTQ
ncbi:MAG: cohesin domain-containing protein [Dissulfuribacterales bacterium]